MAESARGRSAERYGRRAAWHVFLRLLRCGGDVRLGRSTERYGKTRVAWMARREIVLAA